MASLIYWLLRGGSTTLPSASILTETWHTAELSGAAAVLATVLAVPVTSLAMRHRNRLTVLIERLAYLPQALPGLVIALGLVSFSVRYALPLYQSALELIVAYAILFLPLFFAFTGLRTQIGLLDTAGSWLTCLAVIAVATAGKLGGSMAAARLSGMATLDAFALGALMNTRGLIELIALNVGYELGILSPRIFAMLVLMALVTTFSTAPFLALADRLRKRRSAAVRPSASSSLSRS